MEQPYPSEREILDQAVQLEHVQDNLYAPDMIFANAVAAAKILSEKRESTMIRLENHLRRGLTDDLKDEIPLAFGEQKLFQYAAAGDSFLLHYIHILDDEVRNSLV